MMVQAGPNPRPHRREGPLGGWRWTGWRPSMVLGPPSMRRAQLGRVSDRDLTGSELSGRSICMHLDGVNVGRLRSRGGEGSVGGIRAGMRSRGSMGRRTRWEQRRGRARVESSSILLLSETLSAWSNYPVYTSAYALVYESVCHKRADERGGGPRTARDSRTRPRVGQPRVLPCHAVAHFRVDTERDVQADCACRLQACACRLQACACRLRSV